MEIVIWEQMAHFSRYTVIMKVEAAAMLSVMMKEIRSTKNNQTADREAGCPTCGRRTRFSFQGEQRWPQRVAEAAGLASPIIRLWNCHACNTTVCEHSLVQ